MFYIIDCFSGLGVNIGSFIVRVAYGCSLVIGIQWDRLLGQANGKIK